MSRYELSIPSDRDLVRGALGVDVFVTPEMCGAVGDGVANDTDAWNEAIDTGMPVVASKNYLVDGITIDTQTSITIQPDASVKFRSITADADTAVFKFTSNAEGSYIGGGGWIDGNRVSLLSSYLALTKTYHRGGTTYVMESEFDGVRAQSCPDITIENLKFRNILTHAICHRSGDNPKIRNIWVEDCSKVLNAQFFNDGLLENIKGDRIGNQVNGTPVAFWQPAFECRNLSRVVVRNMGVKTFLPTIKDLSGGVIGDPYPTVFVWERLDDCEIEGLDGGEYTFDAADATQTGLTYCLLASAISNCKVDGVLGDGYRWHAEYSSPEGCLLRGHIGYNTLGNDETESTSQSTGLKIRGGGIYPRAGDVETNYRANSAGRQNIVTENQFFGFELGMKIAGGNVLVQGNTCHGARSDGIQIVKAEPNTTTFPGVSAPDVRRVLLKDNDFRFNGHAGINIVDGNALILDGNITDNNGQRTTTEVDASGIRMASGNARDDIRISGGSSSDTQSFTLTGCVSFAPGATDINNRILLLLSDVTRVGIGQYIKIANGAGSGDITARIVDILKDEVTVQSDAPATFSATGNLTALTGTWTVAAGGQTITGTGGAANSEILGPCYIKIGSEYLRVAKVNNDNSIFLTAPVVSAYTGVTVSTVKCNLVGIPSQRRPIYISSDCTNVAWDNNVRMIGNINNDPSVAAASCVATEQEWIVEREVSLNTVGSDTLVTPSNFSAADNVTPLEAAVIVTEDIVGTDGTITFGFGTSTLFYMVKQGLALTKNTKWNGPCTGGIIQATSVWSPISTPDNLIPTVRIRGGSDNIPSGGKVKARIRLKKMTIPAFTNVP